MNKYFFFFIIGFLLNNLRRLFVAWLLSLEIEQDWILVFFLKFFKSLHLQWDKLINEFLSFLPVKLFGLCQFLVQLRYEVDDETLRFKFPLNLLVRSYYLTCLILTVNAPLILHYVEVFKIGLRPIYFSKVVVEHFILHIATRAAFKQLNFHSIK